MFACSARFGYAPPPSLDQTIMGAPARPIEAAVVSGSLRRELGATLALGWPIILANLAINAMTVTDFIMLGRLSPHALAAGSLGFFLYQPLFLFGLGVVGALSPIAAAKIGAGQGNEGLRRATHQALIFAVVYSNGAWRRASCTTRRALRFQRSTAHAQRLSQAFWPSRSTSSPIML
jgi:Na+-driven multidrug efflux pump